MNQAAPWPEGAVMSTATPAIPTGPSGQTVGVNLTMLATLLYRIMEKSYIS